MSEFRVLGHKDDMEVLAESALPNRDESNMVEKKLDQLITAVKGIKPVAPVVNVPAPVVNVESPKFLTISPEQMKELTKKREVYIGGGNSGIVKLVTGTDAVVNPATEEGQEAIVAAIENITIPAPTGGATSLAQTDGTQKTQIVDAGGDSATVTGGKLDVNASIDTTGLATSAKQDVQIENQIDSEYSDLVESSKAQERFDSLVREPDSNELLTIDPNIRLVLGTEKLVENGKVKVNAVPEYYATRKNLPLVTNAVMIIDVVGHNSLAIQVSGTWTGTLTFECSINAGEWIALNGMAVNGTAVIASATANGIYRFNVAGLTKVQIRFSTATTGSPYILAIASPEASSIISNTITATVSGTATTTDSVLPNTLVSQANPINIIPVAPTLTAGVNNFFSKFPQIFQRLRVESAGDKRVPFAQEDNTFKLKVSDDEVRVLLQNILRQLEISNSLKYQELDYNGIRNLRVPEGLVEN